MRPPQFRYRRHVRFKWARTESEWPFPVDVCLLESPTCD